MDMYSYQLQEPNSLAGSSWNTRQAKGLLLILIAALVLLLIGTSLGLGIGVRSDRTTSTSTTTTAMESTTTPLTSEATTTTTTAKTTTTTTTEQTTTSTTSPSFGSAYTGSLSTTSSIYGGVNQSTSNYFYEAIQIAPSVTGAYTLTIASGSNLKWLGYLYKSRFLVTNPSMNLLAWNGSSTGSLQFSAVSNLQSGVEYILVVTTANAAATGLFNVTTSGPGSVAFVARATFSQIITYGTVMNNESDSASNGSVTINSNNVIVGVDGVSANGYVSEVSMAFSKAPNATTGIIYIYVLNRTGVTFVFSPAASHQIPPTSIADTTGLQTFSIPRNQLPVTNGQYVGVGLGAGGGSLLLVPGVSRASLSVMNFSSLTTASYTTDANGVAFSFRVFAAGPVVG